MRSRLQKSQNEHSMNPAGYHKHTCKTCRRRKQCPKRCPRLRCSVTWITCERCRKGVRPKSLCVALEGCEKPIHKPSTKYCVQHYRFENMRIGARVAKKYVPTRKELKLLVPKNMVCVGCERTMSWSSLGGGSTIVTLQHDRDGTLRLICLRCNVRHSRQPGDSFYKIPIGYWRCCRCKKIKLRSDFITARNKNGSRSIQACRVCSAAKTKRWRQKNSKHCSQYRKRAKQKRALNGAKNIRLTRKEIEVVVCALPRPRRNPATNKEIIYSKTYSRFYSLLTKSVSLQKEMQKRRAQIRTIRK